MANQCAEAFFIGQYAEAFFANYGADAFFIGQYAKAVFANYGADALVVQNAIEFFCLFKPKNTFVV